MNSIEICSIEWFLFDLFHLCFIFYDCYLFLLALITFKWNKIQTDVLLIFIDYSLQIIYIYIYIYKLTYNLYVKKYIIKYTWTSKGWMTN